MSKDLIDTRNPGQNPGQFQKGHAPTAGAFKPGHAPLPGSGGGQNFSLLRRKFEQQLVQEMVEQMPPQEAVKLLCEAIRNKERWALVLYINKLSPDQLKIDVTKTEQQPIFDLRNLTDAEVEQFLALAERAAAGGSDFTDTAAIDVEAGTGPETV